MKALLRAGLAAATIGLAISSAHALPVCAPMDFDGDCKSDVLWRNSATGEDYLWLMNGRTIAHRSEIASRGDRSPVHQPEVVFARRAIAPQDIRLAVAVEVHRRADR